MMKNILIDVVMVTYNHEKYIAQAIESVLNQKTDFSFQLIIGEDCSTDATLFICKQYADKYPAKINLINNSVNVGLVKNYERIFNVCTAKYIAIIEGDDYWIDEKKLQKQTEILESKIDVGLVHASSYIQVGNSDKLTCPTKKTTNKKLKNQGYIYEMLIKDNFIFSSTALFRRELLVDKINYNFLVDNNVGIIDFALWLGISIHSKVFFIKDIVGVYRILPTSISNTQSIKDQENFYYTVKKIANYYLDKWPINGYSIKNFEIQINEWLFSKSISLKDYRSVKLYAGKIAKRSLIIILWSYVKVFIKSFYIGSIF